MAANSKTASGGKSSTKSRDTTKSRDNTNSKQRRTLSEWRGDIKEAKGIGFTHGYDCIEELPRELKGGRRAAQSGFKKGAKARENARKAEATAMKYRRYTY